VSARGHVGRGKEISESAICALRRGDHDAFAAVIATYDERLRTLAYHMLGSREAMDDVLQESYLAAYRGLDGFRCESALGTWLYRITYTACLQRLRTAKVTQPLPSDDEETALAAADCAEEQIAVRDELHRSLSSLSPEHRVAVLLVLRDGFSYAEAAEILGVPHGTVASRVAAAREVLVLRLGGRLRGGERG
jgi:RNA polymerase sigma-70 factor, ECF subfamily